MEIVLLYVYRVSNDRLTALLKWYRANGLLPKEKRNAGRQNNSKTYDLDDTKRTVAFISNYADDHALVLPGRVPGFQRDDVRLMPSSETKVKVYGAYRTSMRDLGMLRYKLVDVSHYCSLCCLLLNYNPLLWMILLKLICNNTVFGKFYNITHIF